MNKLVLAAAALTALLGSNAQAAELIGDTVTCSQTSAGSSFACSPFSSTVGAGREFSIGDNEEFFIGLNFNGGGVRVTNLANRFFILGSTIIRLENISSAFSSARVQASSILGFGNRDVSLSNGVLTLDFRGTAWLANSNARIRLETASAVPEPGTWALLVLGFGAIGGAMRARRKRGQGQGFQGAGARSQRALA